MAASGSSPAKAITLCRYTKIQIQGLKNFLIGD